MEADIWTRANFNLRNDGKAAVLPLGELLQRKPFGGHPFQTISYLLCFKLA